MQPVDAKGRGLLVVVERNAEGAEYPALDHAIPQRPE